MHGQAVKYRPTAIRDPIFEPVFTGEKTVAAIWCFPILQYIAPQVQPMSDGFHCFTFSKIRFVRVSFVTISVGDVIERHTDPLAARLLDHSVSAVCFAVHQSETRPLRSPVSRTDKARDTKAGDPAAGIAVVPLGGYRTSLPTST